MKALINLPIDQLKRPFQESIKKFSNIIIKATPGSGKTTRIPLYLLEETAKKIYILEPRRLAAKLAAQQVARELGEKVGERVGYQFRLEKMLSEKTQIVFLTEGTFLKILGKNKNLNDVSVIILDEFHERHLSTDVALSFVSKIQKEIRPDLKMIIMSATIESESVERFLAQSASTTTLELSTNRFELQIKYLPNTTSIIQAPLPKKVRECILDILEKNIIGDILVFLPGMKEIKECETYLTNLLLEHKIECHLLHGDLGNQNQSFLSDNRGHRKVILSTNIAESSVTIPGIRIVIDSGLERSSSHNFYSGLTEIKIEKISKASAAQRAGRANRESKGYCFRLYAELDYEQRLSFIKPEIGKSDLSELYLNTLYLFKLPLHKLNWFEAPSEISLINARELCLSLNAIDESHNLTTVGSEMLKYPLHPRFSRILVEAQKYSEKFFQSILELLISMMDDQASSRILRLIKYRSDLSNSLQKEKPQEEIVLVGFPDRIAKSRSDKHFELVSTNGDIYKIAPSFADHFIPQHSLWIILNLNNKNEVINFLPIEEEWLYELNPFPISEDIQFAWDEKNKNIIQLTQSRIGSIVLSTERNIAKNSHPQVLKIILEKAIQSIEVEKDKMTYKRLLTMNQIIKKIDLLEFEISFINQFLKNFITFSQDDEKLLHLNLFEALKLEIDPESQYIFDSDFPEFLQLNDKRKIPIFYDLNQSPWVESYIQDFYGLTKTPIIAKGKLPLTLKLLGPHKRAIQVTQDLDSFWKKTYPQMLRELSRDYPRHHWPLDPTSSKPILLKRQLGQ